MVVRFGELEVSVVGGHLRTSLDELPEADFGIPLEQLEQPIDYLAPVEVEIDGDEVFSGDVLRTEAAGDQVTVRCQSGVGMKEVQMGAFAAMDVPHQDIVYAAAREGGFDDDHLRIQGLDELPLEVIEVLVPVQRIEVSNPQKVGATTLLPSDRLSVAVESIRPRPEWLDDFEQAEAYALALVTERTLFRAEQAGLSQIDAALSWLAVRASYGFARSPSGLLQIFDRSQSQSVPRRRDEVLVRGLATGRRWLRRPGSSIERASLGLTDSPHLSPALSERLPLSDRQALLAARRALEGDDPVQRTHALWEALEFYAGDIALPKTFSEEDLDSLRAALSDGLSTEQQQRVETLIGNLNEPSLMMRLRGALERDGVPVTPTEYKLLRRLRNLRNAAAHGGEPQRPSSEDLTWACSVLSRALVHRMARYEAAGP
jgi:hypothetical protein